MAKDVHNPEAVTKYIQSLSDERAALVQVIREVILATDTLVAEHIKWNSPAFFYAGEMQPYDPKEYKRDIVVLHLRKPEYVLLVFPTGARVPDPTGLLQGDYTDGRRMVEIRNEDDLNAKAQGLKTVIRLWLKGVE